MDKKKEGLAIAFEAFMETVKELFRPNMSLEDIASKCSPQMDKIILDQKNKGLSFTAGKFKIVCADDSSFCVGYEMYFQDADKKWHQITDLSKKILAKNYLSQEAWLELKQKKINSYDIASPIDKEIESEEK